MGRSISGEVVAVRGGLSNGARRLAVPMLVFALAIGAPRGAVPQSDKVPAEISADLGSCSALITVTGADSQPVYGAKVTARVRYGAMSVKKLDLEAFTGADGKLKIAHLPAVLKKPMVIHVEKDGKGDQVEFKPGERCDATFDVRLR